VWIFIGFTLPSLATGAPAVPLIETRAAGTLSPQGAYAVSMPSAAVQLSSGQWAILDGVNDRIVFTDGEGQGLRSIGEDVLNQPLGMILGEQGQLWVADTANRRIIAMSTQGDVLAEFDVPAGDLPADPVDLALDFDGTSLLVVDNDNHRVVRMDTETGELNESWGEYGEGFDQFNHPYSIAVSQSGRRAVVDVLNSRLLVRDPGFDFTFEIRDWGVEAGQLYRPKGIAIDGEGRIFVTDSVLGVIQVFDADGHLVGVLGDGDEVRHFRTPTRLGFDPQGRLIVVEMRANRISLWDVAP
jgi:DNA-binding beta-propeller fold protein YncE